MGQKKQAKGQLSLEALILFVIGVSFLVFLFPAVTAVKDAGDYAQKSASEKLITSKLSAGCEEVLITNEQKAVEFISLANFTLAGVPNCVLSAPLEIREGKNSILVEPGGEVRG